MAGVGLVEGHAQRRKVISKMPTYFYIEDCSWPMHFRVTSPPYKEGRTVLTVENLIGAFDATTRVEFEKIMR